MDTKDELRFHWSLYSFTDWRRLGQGTWRCEVAGMRRGTLVYESMESDHFQLSRLSSTGVPDWSMTTKSRDHLPGHVLLQRVRTLVF